MDSLIGIKGKDFIIIAADTFNAYSVLKMKVHLSIMTELRRQDLESRRIKTPRHWRWTLRCHGLQWLHSKKSCLSRVQKRRQVVNRRHCQLHPTRTRWSHQKRTLLSQLSFGRIRRQRAKTVLVGLPRLSCWAEEGCPWVCWILNQHCHGYSWNQGNFIF